MTESLLLSFISFFVAIIVVFLLLPQFNEITDKEISNSFDLPVLLSFMGLTLLTGIVSGSYPALYLSGFTIVKVLKGEIRSSLAELWARKGLVVFQFTLSIIPVSYTHLQARFYFQVITGKVKMSNFSEQGQEFVQGLFSNGQSFGEPPLLADLTYPASAIAASDCQLFKLGKDKFLDLLLHHPKLNLSISEVLARRLHYKAVMASEISSHHPEHRILTLLRYLKDEIHPDTRCV